jgi:hypothetical protein
MHQLHRLTLVFLHLLIGSETIRDCDLGPDLADACFTL